MTAPQTGCQVFSSRGWTFNGPKPALLWLRHPVNLSVASRRRGRSRQALGEGWGNAAGPAALTVAGAPDCPPWLTEQDADGSLVAMLEDAARGA